mgnify:CR=1 FL=1
MIDLTCMAIEHCVKVTSSIRMVLNGSKAVALLDTSSPTCKELNRAAEVINFIEAITISEW